MYKGVVLALFFVIITLCPKFAISVKMWISTNVIYLRPVMNDVTTV